MGSVSRHVLAPKYMVQSRFMVCIVDDDVSVRASVARLLGEHGHPVKTFESGSEFLKQDPCTTECRLLVDVTMPEMDGIELVRQLQRGGRPERVVFMSARDDETIRRRIAEIGPIELVRKPFAAEHIIAALVRAVPLAEQ